MISKALLIIGLWSVFADSASAVCLDGHPTVPAEYRHSYVVFIGTVIAESMVLPPDEHFDDGKMYTIKVDEIYHGSAVETLRLFSENDSGRFPMDVGTRYLLFAHRDHGQLIVDSCGNSEVLNDKSSALAAVRKLKAEANSK